MDKFIGMMNQIEDLLTLLRADILGEMCGLEPILAVNGHQFIKCYQCDDGIMYDIYDSDPRLCMDDDELEPDDGGCLTNSEEDLDIDFFGILSKLEFIGTAHLPVEVTPLDDMQARYHSEYKEHLQFATDRNWMDLGFDSPEEMMETIEVFTEEENTIFEAGWRAGFEEAMRVARDWYKAEGIQV